MRELAIRWIAVGKARQDRDLSLWVKAGFEGASVIGMKRTCRGSMPMSDLPIPIRSLADAVLADERVSFASTLPAAAIRRLPQRAMSST
jgi:hypothetical protein